MNRDPRPPIIDADDDDRPIGRVLTRRQALALLGTTASTAVLAACAPAALTGSPATSEGVSTTVPACVEKPELTEGPYHVDAVMERSDIRANTDGSGARDGVPLALTFAVARIGDTCAPFEGAVVDVWHCDGIGEYSGVSGQGQSDQTGTSYLRGYQVTDASGLATFQTIYPGWYSGRAVHIHFKIRTNPASNSGSEFTSQLFFDDDLSAELFTTRDPYSQKGRQDVTNDRDNIYQQSGGQLLLSPTADGDGYAATFAIGVQL